MLNLRSSALFAGIVAVVAGLLLYPPWEPQLTKYAVWSLPRVAGLLAASWLLARLLKQPLALGLGIVEVLLMVHFHGMAAVASTLLMLCCGLGIGSLIVAPPPPHAQGRAVLPEISDAPWFALLIGCGLLAALAGWLLPFPIFSPSLLICLMVLISLLCRRRIGQHVQHAVQTLSTAVREQPLAGGCAVLVLLVAGMPAWLPVLSADDLASHLQIGWQLQTHGYYRMDVGSQVWALAPWLADVQYGLLQVMAGSEVAPVLNMVWLAITGWLVVRLAISIGLSGAFPWLAAMLYLSLPITGALTMSMQTETLTSMVVAALALLIARAPTRPDHATLLAAAALAGILIGTKVLNLVFAGPLGLFLLWRWRFALPWRSLPAALVLAVFIGGSSYTYAWLLTGNPVLPLFNDIFQSPWFGTERMSDQRWQAGISLATPFWLTFSASDYHESGLNRGAAGLALVLLFAGSIGSAIDPRSRSLLLVGLGAWLLAFGQIQYLRYTVPTLALLIPVLLAGVCAPMWRRTAITACAATVVLQLALMPSASWMLASGAVRFQSRAGDALLLQDYAPERAIASHWRQHRKPSDRLLIASPNFAAHAEFAGAAFVSNWYDPALSTALRAAAVPTNGWADVVERAGATHILVRHDETSGGLGEYLAGSRAELEKAIGAAWLYRIPQQKVAGREVETASGRVALRFPLASDSFQLTSVSVEVSCSAPFQPISVSWTLKRADQSTGWQRFSWQTCPASGRAIIAVEQSLPEGWSTVELELGPTSPDSAQRIALIEQSMLQRPDLARDRELSRIVRGTICRRWRMCRRLDGPRLLGVSE